MPKKTIIITGLADYIRRVVNLKPRKSEIPLYGLQELVYRGLSKKDYSLTPALGREVSQYWMNTMQTKEMELINQAQQKFPTIFKDTDLPVIRLAKLQHYGIPTRLMDVSSNPLVALFFACFDQNQRTKSHNTRINWHEMGNDQQFITDVFSRADCILLC